MNNKKNTLLAAKNMLAGGKQNIVIIFTAIVLFVVFSLIKPYFSSSDYVLNMSKDFVPYAIMSLGVTFVIATGGIDLSIGTVCIGSAVLAGAICRTGVSLEDGNLALTIPIILVTGLVFGLINGLLVAKCKIAPFIATLGTMLVSRGITAVASEVLRQTPAAVKYPPSGTWFQSLFTSWDGFPIGMIWVLALTAICMVVMYKTKVGRYILAIGSNEEAARLSGINVDKYKIIAYSICGLFAGIAALFYVAATGSLTIAGGNGMELNAVAGVYIGGSSTTGGAATIVGTILGSMILVIIRSGLNLVLNGSGVSATNVTYAVTGVIVVGAVLLDVLKKKSAAKVKIDAIDKAKSAK